ncbi:hypothetical protein FRC03_001642 [Tulasnella sp. 419]|nr:hypothetical protein FRC03_001642 [Tulasnella sp. 419]
MSLEAITLSSPPLESKKPLGAGLAGVDGLPSQDSKVSPSFPTYGSHKSLGRAALVPMVMVVIWSLGLGSVLLGWLLVKRLPLVPGSWSNIFDGYLVVDEGNKTGSVGTLDGQETLESTMRGVLIITVISHSSSMAVIPLMSLGAFYVAATWLDDQTKSKQGPTPLQLGLVAQMCSSGTWDSVWLTSRYLLRNWRTKSPATRANVSSLLHCALGICSTIMVLHYAVIITDLLLSAELGSAYYPLLSEIGVHSGNASTLGTQYNSVLYEVPPSPEDDANRYIEALEAISGRSSRNNIITINNYNSSEMEDTSSMAVITRPHVPFSWSWKASTIGISARCRPAPCKAAPKDPRSVSCSPHSGPDDNFPLPSFDYVTPSAHHAYYITPSPPKGEELQGFFPKIASEREDSDNSFHFIMAV